MWEPASIDVIRHTLLRSPNRAKALLRRLVRLVVPLLRAVGDVDVLVRRRRAPGVDGQQVCAAPSTENEFREGTVRDADLDRAPEQSTLVE